MSQKIGPKEAALKAQREASFSQRKTAKPKPVAALRQAIAAVPVKRAPKPRRGRKL